MTIIEFDNQKDPEATPKFIQWQEERQQKRERDARLLQELPAEQQAHRREALVLEELAAGRFMLHVETCSHLTHPASADMTNARKIVHA